MARVRLICVSDRFTSLRALLASLCAQTFPDWTCLVLDQTTDGRSDCFYAADEFPDDRILCDVVKRVGDWGQTAKWEAAMQSTEEYLGFPADDAYYAPVYLERMVAALDAGNDLVYCDWVYNQPGYVAVAGTPQVGLIDVGGFLVRRSVLEKVGWENRSHEGDGILVEKIVAQGYKHARVPGLLYTKN